MYQIYTLPTCEHCHAALDLMKRGRIEFEQVDATSPEGIRRFREFYAKHREQIRRDGSGCALLPVVVYQENGDVRVHQGTEDLEKFLGLK